MMAARTREFQMRSPRSTLVDARRWSALALSIAAAFLASIASPAQIAAQAVLPSQVTPQTLRPPAVSGEALNLQGSDGRVIFPPSENKLKKQPTRKNSPPTRP